jgi:hypothetical protein
MGDALRIIGFTLWIPALLLLIGSAACGAFVGTKTVGGATSTIRNERIKTADRLQRIEGIDPQAVAEFRTAGQLSNSTKSAMSTRVREQVDREITMYGATGAGATIGRGAATGIAGLGVLVTYVVCVPLFIVGLLLTRKKNVWRCPTCQYIFDRA